MNILHIVEATFAGVGRHVLDQVAAQLDDGNEVTVAYSPRRESPSFTAGRLALGDATWLPLPMARRPHPGDAASALRLRRLASRIRPDVVHGHSSKGGLLARSLRRDRCRVVYTPNAVYSMNPRLGLVSRSVVGGLERRLANRTDTIIAVSPEERRHLIGIGIGPERVSLIPNGIGPVSRADRDQVRAALGLPADGPVVGFVGRLDAQKAPDDLLAVSALVARQRPDANIAVVGDGPERDAVAACAATEAVLDGRFHLLGEQPGTWAMAAFDVLLLPSRYEGFPYVLIEAAHLGVPIVTTWQACPSLLVDGPATVAVVDSGDVLGLAARCLELLGHGGRGRPDRRFTASAMVAATLAAYELDGRGAEPVREQVPAHG